MRPQVYISSDFGATFTQANINGGADRSWAAVSYSRDGSTLVAAAGSSVELRRVAAKALGSRVANRAEQQMQQSRRSAKPAEIHQADTVWISRDKGSTWTSAAQDRNAPSYFMDVALSANGAKMVAVQRGPASSDKAGIYEADVSASSANM